MKMSKSLLILLFVIYGVSGQSCNVNNRTDCGYFGINQQQCEAKGCCWIPSDNQNGLKDVPYCFYKSKNPPSEGTCRPDAIRSDCGYDGINQTGCEHSGCCWDPKQDEPWCFYKSNPPSKYIVQSVEKTAVGVKITIAANKTNIVGKYGNLISPLVVEISSQTAERLHVKIYDPNSNRWEIPTNISPAPTDPNTLPSSTLYTYRYSNIGEEFMLSVVRTADGDVLFNTSDKDLLFYDQFLSISTRLPEDNNIYGIGEHVTPYLKLKPRTYTLWNYDIATPQYLNLYGSHPFYLDLRSSSGNSHGVYLRNSNGMDVILTADSLTYNVIGGVFDFYFFLGPQPERVIQQYQEVIGRPHFPPYWALGFHQCRYGYPNVETLEEVVKNYTLNNIPLDTIWTDIDYMNEHKDFTLNPVNFPLAKMKSFVTNLHGSGKHYVVIIDPGIEIFSNGYTPYTDGISMDIFIKDKNGYIFTGKVWPGITGFPDFFNPKTNQYWEDQIAKFHDLLPIDGLWIDMNEISNFCSGECTSLSNGMPIPTNREEYTKIRESYDKWLRSKVHKPNKSNKYTGFDPISPPYAINNQGNKFSLETRTVSTDAVHYGGILEYNVHNLFGLTESIATNIALQNIRKSRSLVISRSTFPGSGAHSGHWTGDNHATWDDLYLSIPDVLNFQMFGIPLVGADICGYLGDTNEELCGRWMQLGAFYPFSRNHNSDAAVDQEPYRWTSVAEISRTALNIRYSILPYYYTQFYKAHIGTDTKSPPTATVIKPLFFEFPTDKNTYEIDRQFLIGNGILISPVLEEGVSIIDAYFPSGIWYDYYTSLVETDKGGLIKTLSAPTDHIPIHIRGGTIIPMQDPGLTTTESRKNPFSLKIALDEKQQASGDIFYDDGESLDITNYIFVNYEVANNELKAVISGYGYFLLDIPKLNTITVIGLSTKPRQVTLNGAAINGFTYDDDFKTMTLANLNIYMTENFTIRWM